VSAERAQKPKGCENIYLESEQDFSTMEKEKKNQHWFS